MQVLRLSLLLASPCLVVACSQPTVANAAGSPRIKGEVLDTRNHPANLRETLQGLDSFVPSAANPGEEMTWDVPVYRALLPTRPEGDKQAFRRAVNTPKSLDKLYARLRVEVWRDRRAGGLLKVRVSPLSNPADKPLPLRGPILVLETANPLGKRGADYAIEIGKIWLSEHRVQGKEIMADGGPPFPAETWVDVVVQTEIGGAKLPVRLRQVKVRER